MTRLSLRLAGLTLAAHSSNAATSMRGARLEVLWSNRPLLDGRLDLGLG